MKGGRHPDRQNRAPWVVIITRALFVSRLVSSISGKGIIELTALYVERILQGQYQTSTYATIQCRLREQEGKQSKDLAGSLCDDVEKCQ